VGAISSDTPDSLCYDCTLAKISKQKCLTEGSERWGSGRSRIDKKFNVDKGGKVGILGYRPSGRKL